MIGQPSSPGICVSELRFVDGNAVAGEATVWIDMAALRLIDAGYVSLDGIADASK